jgi:hypothetical protein
MPAKSLNSIQNGIAKTHKARDIQKGWKKKMKGERNLPAQ